MRFSIDRPDNVLQVLTSACGSCSESRTFVVWPEYTTAPLSKVYERETARHRELDAELHKFSALTCRAKTRGAILGMLASLWLVALVLSLSHFLGNISAELRPLRVAPLKRPTSASAGLPAHGGRPRDHTPGPVTRASSTAFREFKNRAVHALRVVSGGSR